MKKENKFEFGPYMLILSVVLFLTISMCSCSSADQNWYKKKRTVSGRHDYYAPGWRYDGSCKTYSVLPTKKGYYNKMKYYRRSN